MSIWTDLLLFHGHVISPGTLALLMNTRAAASDGAANLPAEPRDPRDPDDAAERAVNYPPHPLRQVGQLR
jgi:hypothetical protein